MKLIGSISQNSLFFATLYFNISTECFEQDSDRATSFLGLAVGESVDSRWLLGRSTEDVDTPSLISLPCNGYH